MAWKKEPFGTLPTGEEAELYTLTNHTGVSASFTNLGAVWIRMIVPDKNGDLDDVLLGNANAKQVLTNAGHLGEVVGRNANRIGGAAFTLNGKTYTLSVNSGGKNNLHSGPDYYAFRLWDAKVEEHEEGTSVAFSLHSPDGDQGYPGNADITVTYTLTESNALKLEYRMTADADTIANFTNHAYFNLAGHKSGTVLNQKVWIDADNFTPADETSIPYGTIVPVSGTPMDFTEMKPIGRDIEAAYEQLQLGNGYDHNWVLNHKPGELALSAKLLDETSGRCMEVYTDLPGIQFYTANFLNGQPGKDDAWYEKRQGCCFETQYYPDAANKPQFPQPFVKAGEEYHTITVYQFVF